MRKKTVWLVASCLITASLVTVSCAPAEEVGGGVYGTATTEPQYGGSITFWLVSTDFFDPVFSSNAGPCSVLTYDKLVTGDWSKGPAGTGEYSFEADHVPEQFRTGHLAESWEMPDSQTRIYHIRKGVHFHDVPPVNGREMTADDVLYTFEWCQNHPKSTFYVSPAQREAGNLATYTKIDDWTIKVENYQPDIALLDGASWVFVVPHEMIEEYGDLSDWRHACGTGPFVVENVIEAGSATWKRNPDYWMQDPVHPKNQLPYVDTLTGVVMPDETAALSALRTHQLDMLPVAWDKATSVIESNPELVFVERAPRTTNVMFMRTDKEPYSDKRVRQALALAIDQQTIAGEYFEGSAHVLTWPYLPVNAEAFTPLEELPDEIRQLYEYHPEKAKELLTEAGYPDGFECEVIVYLLPGAVDQCTIVKEYLADVGINMEVNVVEGSTFSSLIYGRRYNDLAYCLWGNSSPQSTWGWAHGGVVDSIFNFSNVVDPIAQEGFDEWRATEDPVERSRMMKEEYLRQMELCWEIPLVAPTYHMFWAPWLGGFHGEVGLGLTSPMGANERFRYIWVDQELKSAITGQ